jgi:nucleotide-binding universal stress UspA family protein
MSLKTILVQLADDPAATARLEVARRLARRHDAHLIGLHVLLPPLIATGLYGEAAIYAGPQLLEAQREANEELSQRVKTAFERLCGNDPDSEWREIEGEPAAVLAKEAHTTDLVVVAQNRAPELESWRVAEHLVVAAGTPVLMLPPTPVSELGKRILVGWDGSREACRAAHDALPLLLSAEGVVLCSVGDTVAETLEAAAQMLRRHRVSLEVEWVKDTGLGAGQTLLDRAARHGCNLVVMGAYGHSRLRELVFGGATRHVLFEAEMPILFSS